MKWIQLDDGDLITSVSSNYNDDVFQQFYQRVSINPPRLEESEAGRGRLGPQGDFSRGAGG